MKGFIFYFLRVAELYRRSTGARNVSPSWVKFGLYNESYQLGRIVTLLKTILVSDLIVENKENQKLPTSNITKYHSYKTFNPYIFSSGT